MNTHDGSFEACASVPAYVNVNKQAIRAWIATMQSHGETHIRRILDIATGVGTMAHITMKNLPGAMGRPEIVCLDKSVEALEIASARLFDPDWRGRIRFLQSAIENIVIEPNSICLAVWGNGIHYLSDQDQVRALKAIYSALRPGGWFCFNSTFYGGVYTENTKRFYRAQVINALRILKERGVAKIADARPPEAAKHRPVEHYTQLVAASGFELIEACESVVKSSYDFWQALTGYHQYAEGALHGYPPAEASLALQDGVREALNDHGYPDEALGRFIPRPWLEVMARKVLS